MTVFGRRRTVPVPKSNEPLKLARPPMLTRLFARLWAGLVVFCAIGELSGGHWLGGLCLIAHAALVWPEVGEAAARWGLTHIRLVVAWVLMALFIAPIGLGLRADRDAVPAPVTPLLSRSDTVSTLAAPEPRALATYRAKIADHAVSEIDRSDYYISVYRKLGPARAHDANTLAPWVALRVAFSSSCDRVDMVEISKDADWAELRWFVDCLNRQRFHVNEADAEATRAKFAGMANTGIVQLLPDDLPGSENAKVSGFDERTGLNLCEASVRNRLQRPDAYRHTGSARIMRHPQRGRVTISRDFTALNGLGQPIRSQWECLLEAGDMRVIEIKWLDAGQWRVAAKE